ncbi:MAG: hypothetical protein K0R82_1035 [Flavipsychrobacter sp.]|jgi:hypothetical protein|nr:hypothetical protein [Flavipsychrobacter sp.]
MSVQAQALNRVNNFFESYAQALENFDTKAMAQHYSLPCTFLDDKSAEVFTEASKLEGLFNQGVGFYKQFGITYVRPDVWSKRAWTDRIIKVKLNWQYFDKDKKPVYNCDYNYILRLDKHDKWKIEVAVSINEKEHMEAWLQKRDGQSS